MTILAPTRFRFPGFAPEFSAGLAVLVDPHRILVTDAPDNPGTSVTNAIEAVPEMARRALGVGEDTEILQWSPDRGVVPGNLWRIVFEGRDPNWVRVEDPDPSLARAVEILREQVATG